VPIYGDILAGVLQLYQVWLAFIFGVPLNILGYMVSRVKKHSLTHSLAWAYPKILNVIIDTVVGFVPLLGDYLDNLFKSNLRNLALLETWLLSGNVGADRYRILLMPETTEFIPHPSKSKSARGWFGRANKTDEEVLEREEERRTGRVRKTRRMGRDEGQAVGAGSSASANASASGSASSSSYPAATSTRVRRDPVYEPLD
jgi:hypothetical protein